MESSNKERENAKARRRRMARDDSGGPIHPAPTRTARGLHKAQQSRSRTSSSSLPLLASPRACARARLLLLPPPPARARPVEIARAACEPRPPLPTPIRQARPSPSHYPRAWGKGRFSGQSLVASPRGRAAW
jgi:hypothetical protein